MKKFCPHHLKINGSLKVNLMNFLTLSFFYQVIGLIKPDEAEVFLNDININRERHR